MSRLASATRPSSRRPNRIVKLLALTFGCTLAIGCVELALRLVGYRFPVNTQADAHCGYAYVPHSTWEHRTEGQAQIDINSFGFRDREWTLEKPDGTVRIAVVGDSFVAGFEVAAHERFSAVLATELVAANTFEGQHVEVMNFGQGGFGTAQELMVLRHKVLRFKPDIVLLALFTANDIRNNSRALEKEPLVPYFNLDDGNQLILDETYRDHAPGIAVRTIKSLAPYFRSVQVVYQFWQTRKTRLNTPQNDARFAKFHFTDPLAESIIYSLPVDNQWADAWKVTEALIKEFQRESAKHQAKLLLVSLANDIQVHPDVSLRDEYMRLIGVDDLFYPDRKVAEIGENLQIPTWTLAPTMQRRAEEKHTFFHGFANTRLGVGHWNREGHLFAGVSVAKWISEQFPTATSATH